MKLEKKIYTKLKALGYKIATAESLTGGMLASTLVSVAGASDILDMSFVTYSNQAKNALVGVSFDAIEKYNVVSQQVAKQMAEGAKQKASCQVGLATTGLAGPGGGTKEIPVGTVCFGIALNNKTYTFKHQFKNISRTYIRKKSVKYILNKLNKLLDTKKWNSLCCVR